MDLASLTDESLNAKPIKKGAVGQPMTKKAKISSDTDVSADQEAQGDGPSKLRARRAKLLLQLLMKLDKMVKVLVPPSPKERRAKSNLSLLFTVPS
jgi:hypothetical protein